MKENQETRRARARISRIVQKGLEDAGAVAPADVYHRPLTCEKKPAAETMDIPEVEVSDADVLKFGRRVAMMLKAGQSKDSPA